MQEHFYHALTNKYIAAFGSMFNDITLVKYNKAKTDEIKRTKVPIFFGPREKYLVFNEEKSRKVQVTLPLMTYNLTDMTMDLPRKQNSLLRMVKANTATGNADSAYMGVPYDLTFELAILSRSKDDAYQIIEQILPSFLPSYTFSQILIPELGFVKDIPVTLNSITNNTAYDGDFNEIVTVEFTLTFTMKVNYYGPVTRTAVIHKAFANTFIDPSLYAGALVRANLNDGNNGNYYLDDVVYQGEQLSEATAAGIVSQWRNAGNSSYIIIGGVQGDFKTNTKIKAASSNASYTLASFDATPLKVQSIMIEPDPITARPPDDYGFAETLKEYPDTLD